MGLSHSVLLLALLTTATAAAHADNIYSLNLSNGSATATGTITTDGTLGTLQTSNITGYTITLNDGINTPTVSNGTFFVVGDDLFATNEGLFYNFDDTQVLNYAGFAGANGNYSSFLCFSGSANCGNSTGPQAVMRVNSLPFLLDQSGTQQIASAAAVIAQTPEPSSLALMGTGLLGIYGAARRRFV